MSTAHVPVPGARPRSSRPIIPAVVLGVIALAAGWPGRCRAGDQDLSGRVADSAGAAVAGAEVWVIGGEWEHPRPVARATTDDQGRFVLVDAWKPRGAGTVVYLSVMARAPDGRMGWKSTVWARSAEDADLRIPVGPVVEARGRLRDHEGRPIAGVAIVPAILTRPDPEHTGHDNIRIPPELAGLMKATTDADGAFALRGIPRGAEVGAAVAAPGFGEPRVFWDSSKPPTIALDGRLGRIEGTLKPSDARGLAGKLKIPLRREVPTGDAASAVPFRVTVLRSATPDGQGRFRFDGLPPGTYAIDLASGEGVLAETDRVDKIEVRPDTAARVEVPVRRLLAIAGRVVDARTGRGIEGVGIYSSLITPQHFAQFIGQARTDADGRFTAPGKPGKVQLGLNSVPKAYLGLLDAQRPTLDVQGDRTWPDMKLDPAVVLEGVVVDAAGRPVEGAEVHALPLDTSGHFSQPAPTRTGPDGTFRFEQIDPDDTLPVWARTREATTDGMVVIRPKDLNGKRLTLTIDPKYAFRIRGRVTDRSGHRLAGAKAVVWWYRSYKSEKLGQGRGIGTTFEVQTLDRSGWFVFRGLWPGDRYKVVIEAPGGGKAEPPQATGKAGETADLGTIAMAGAVGHIAGRVVGSDGKPIAGATVLNRGDGPRPITVHTDASGQFRLDGLFPDAKYAFARKDGYRFTGVRVDGDADDLVLTMLRTDEPPPAWTPAAGPSLADQRAFARRMLIRVWETSGQKAGPGVASSCIGAMARLDPETALQWSADRGHQFDGTARRAAAEELAETDAPAAMAMLAPADANTKQEVFRRLAGRFAGSDPKKAATFIDESVVQARSLLQPARTHALAEVGEALVRLGRKEAGRKLIDEAAVDAARLGTAGMEGYARGIVARAVAPFDADRALALVAPFTDKNTKERYTGFVAGALSGVNPDRALAMVEALGQESSLADTLRSEIAFRVAARDPDRAVRIVEGMKTHAADKERAEAMGWLAVAVAPRDRARAASLIDRALAVPVDRPDLFRSWVYYGGGTMTAARIAACARHAGYPDMDSVLMRAMATRVGLGDRQGHDPAMEIQSATKAAVPLALIDPGAARTLLGQIEARAGLDPARLAEVAGEDWLRAWSLVDLDKAAALVDAALAAPGQADAASLRRIGLFPMIDTLIQPPDRREAEVFHVDGPSWRPAFAYWEHTAALHTRRENLDFLLACSISFRRGRAPRRAR